jgi:hypothetical protein
MVETLVPHVESLDSSLDLYQEGYLFIKNRMDQLHTDLFTVNLLAQKVICISGSEAAGLFYNPDLFLRSGAAPKHVQKTLFGENAIQSMDGEEHLARKAVFLSLTSEEYQKKLVNLIQQELPGVRRKMGGRRSGHSLLRGKKHFMQGGLPVDRSFAGRLRSKLPRGRIQRDGRRIRRDRSEVFQRQDCARPDGGMDRADDR